MRIPFLTDELTFPSPACATREGVVAVGGDLSVARLVRAYRSGIFPWPIDDYPLVWFSPDPRLVLFPEQLKVPKSLARIIRSGRFQVTFNRDFRAVIEQCRAARRPGQPGTWILPEMVEAYCRLNAAGHARSVEVWQEGALVGGLYGVVVGRCFTGESMFSAVSNASKVALVALVERLQAEGCTLIDCQVHTPHLAAFGALEVPRKRFLELLRACLD
jgi:leucyl/phenylalanyl-tRNA---protein transferase